MTPLDIITVCVLLISVLAVIHFVIILLQLLKKPRKATEATGKSKPSLASLYGAVESKRAPLESVREEEPPGSPTPRRLSRQTSTTTFARTAKGKVKIVQCDPMGHFVRIENTGALKDENLSGWVLSRTVLGLKERRYNFPEGYVLPKETSVKVWAKGYGKENPPTDLVYEDDSSWGMGRNVETILIDTHQINMATHSQKTVITGGSQDGSF